MKLDGAKVAALRTHRPDPADTGRYRPFRSQRDLALELRRVGCQCDRAGTWVSMVERGRIDVTEYQACCLAVALGVGLSDLLPADAATAVAIARVADDLGQVRELLDAVALTVGGIAASAVRQGRLPAREGVGA